MSSLPTQSPILLALLCLLAAAFVFWRVNATAKDAVRRQSLQKLDLYATQVAAHEPEVTGLMDLLRRANRQLSLRLVTTKQRNQLQRLLDRAGQRGTHEVSDAAQRKLQYGVIFFVVSLLLGLAGNPFWIFASPLVGAGGFFLPELLIYNAGLKRTEEIERGLADAIDLLSMCVEAGLGFDAAMSRVANSDAGAIAEEFAAVLTELQFGKSRADALRDLANRNSVDDLSRFVNAMSQVDRLGVPVSRVLEEQAREMRDIRRSRAREQAQKVPIKILAPMMLCFLPALFIIILGPAVIMIIRSFSGG